MYKIQDKKYMESKKKNIYHFEDLCILHKTYRFSLSLSQLWILGLNSSRFYLNKDFGSCPFFNNVLIFHINLYATLKLAGRHTAERHTL